MMDFLSLIILIFRVLIYLIIWIKQTSHDRKFFNYVQKQLRIFI